MSLEEASNFMGLPAAQLQAAKLNGGFDFFSITAKQGQNPVLFTSKIAPTEQRVFTQIAGAEQVIVPNRTLFTDAVKVEPNAPRTFPPKRPGG